MFCCVTSCCMSSYLRVRMSAMSYRLLALYWLGLLCLYCLLSTCRDIFMCLSYLLYKYYISAMFCCVTSCCMSSYLRVLMTYIFMSRDLKRGRCCECANKVKKVESFYKLLPARQIKFLFAERAAYMSVPLAPLTTCAQRNNAFLLFLQKNSKKSLLNAREQKYFALLLKILNLFK